jgi:hypothetical protein
MTVYEPAPYVLGWSTATTVAHWDSHYRFDVAPLLQLERDYLAVVQHPARRCPARSTEWSEPRESQPWPEPDPSLAAYWKQD